MINIFQHYFFFLKASSLHQLVLGSLRKEQNLEITSILIKNKALRNKILSFFHLLNFRQKYLNFKNKKMPIEKTFNFYI